MSDAIEPMVVRIKKERARRELANRDRYITVDLRDKELCCNKCNKVKKLQHFDSRFDGKDDEHLYPHYDIVCKYCRSQELAERENAKAASDWDAITIKPNGMGVVR